MSALMDTFVVTILVHVYQVHTTAITNVVSITSIHKKNCIFFKDLKFMCLKKTKKRIIWLIVAQIMNVIVIKDCRVKW